MKEKELSDDNQISEQSSTHSSDATVTCKDEEVDVKPPEKKMMKTVNFDGVPEEDEQEKKESSKRFNSISMHQNAKKLLQLNPASILTIKEDAYNNMDNRGFTSNLLSSHNIKTSLDSSPNNGIKDVSFRRRQSSYCDTFSDKRRDSVRTMFFGNPVACNRRFSQDLRLPEFPEEEEEIENETAKVVFFQIFIPFLIAGFGNVGAGIILDNVQHWLVFKRVSELFILVATFLGIKGNLEMTLAARLSTQANLGQIDTAMKQLKIGVGNVALVQCQSIVIAMIASFLAVGADFMKEFRFNFDNALIICATSLITASLSGLFLAVIMIIVVIISRKIGVNPDNVATLIAAFLGDITAVSLLAGSARLLFTHRDNLWLSPVIIAFFVLILPLCFFVTRRNEYTRDIVGKGWIPILVAVIISSSAGFVLDIAVGLFDRIAIFQPIINGVGSNLVAVQTSRISTYYYQRSSMGELPDNEDGRKPRVCETPFNAYIGSNPNVRTARLLLLMAIPGHIIYIVIIRMIKSENVIITGYFILFYLSSSALQVATLLYIAYVLVPFLWKRKIDPDNAAIPGVMATGDLLGTTLLTCAFLLLSSIGDPNAIML